MSEAVLLVGTKKGLWIGRVGRRAGSGGSWSEPEFLMQGIYATCIDTRGDQPRLFVSGTSEHWGPGVYRSDDLGRTWTETQGAAVHFPDDLGQQRGAGLADPARPGRRPDVRLRRHAAVGAVPVRRPRRDLRAGPLAVGPPAPARVGRRVRRSGHPHDRARTPTTRTGSPWPCPPAGSTRPTDGGESWSPSNTGIKAYFFPDPWPEFGQCVHKVASHPARPERMYAQNHHGVYRSDDGGHTWMSIADGLPSDFGFPIVVHPARPRHRVRLPAGGRRGTDPAARPGPDLALHRRRARPGRRRARACPTASTPRSCATR